MNIPIIYQNEDILSKVIQKKKDIEIYIMYDLLIHEKQKRKLMLATMSK